VLTDHYKNCIDYIFVSNDIEVLNVNYSQDKIIEWEKNNIWMPNREFPSDHINLVADIEIS